MGEKFCTRDDRDHQVLKDLRQLTEEKDSSGLQIMSLHTTCVIGLKILGYNITINFSTQQKTDDFPLVTGSNADTNEGLGNVLLIM